jgi:hypothetical protein
MFVLILIPLRFLLILSVAIVANIFSTSALDKSNTVNPDEVVLLRLQLKYMKLYANTLNLRIAGTKGVAK